MPAVQPQQAGEGGFRVQMRGKILSRLSVSPSNSHNNTAIGETGKTITVSTTSIESNDWHSSRTRGTKGHVYLSFVTPALSGENIDSVQKRVGVVGVVKVRGIDWEARGVGNG